MAQPVAALSMLERELRVEALRLWGMFEKEYHSPGCAPSTTPT